MRLDATGLEIGEFLRGYDKLIWLYRVGRSVEAGGALRHFAQAEAASPTRRGLQPLSKQDAECRVAYILDSER
jgi:hypothetical protein